jgi:hypothetical protein
MVYSRNIRTRKRVSGWGYAIANLSPLFPEYWSNVVKRQAA